MAKSVQRKTDRSPEEVARLRELRERYQREKPSIADLEAKGLGMLTRIAHALGKEITYSLVEKVV